ncbi:response regulator transcription factor [Paenibacillus thalictri]|uniref:Response regulator n=1 Tax=Paenibacillus thalictri TaxID=2527873 RepID=A0A4Q9DGW1_9BACL|nr:helix-turn-helix domain-containing protein [Paenibacillus thalictri]TBL70517.1 response regulator [Paenibacillus thalictri]
MNCKAILIDDEAWIREGLAEHLEWKEMGIELCGAFADGSQALSYVLAAEVHIILTDIRMPNMTGLELIATLKEHSAEKPELDRVKIVFLSGYDEFAYAQQALRFGAVDFLLKPADEEDIQDALLRAKKQWQMDSAKLQPVRHPEGADNECSPVSYIIKKALHIVNERYTEDLQLAQLAEEVFVTPNYLSRLFKQETGQSFSECVSQLRLEKAKELLTNTAMKVYQIGETVGYPNPRYFNEWFQKATGLTPTDYRNRYTG